MKSRNSISTFGVAATLAATGFAGAAQVNVSSDITSSTTWTANNTYNLTTQIYVRNGATLTIEPGTIIASVPSVNGSGSLAITRGSMIIADGNASNPIIFTSTADVATWDGTVMSGQNVVTPGDPQTGEWREAASEWGNLTIMGQAFISENIIPDNVPTCNANNYGVMEGLTEATPGDLRVRYGGNMDGDDSGTLDYVSIRYGGRVVGLDTELNGLSLGGVGRATDIGHIEIMNNVDDGIEIWGGVVNLKWISIWNIGDDSFDVDQGWRGKAQFGLIVQGYSTRSGQGSGTGDNCLEMDGAEDSDYQPVTTATLYNFTVIGQPLSGDHGTAWRDNARVQIRKSIFMDLGERLIFFENIDGDGGSGYGHNGTLSWAQTWTTPYTATSTVNPCNNAANRYLAQSAGDSSIDQGFLAEITDSVFRNNMNANAYTESNARGVTVGGNDAPDKGNVVVSGLPIMAITRGPNVAYSTFVMQPVVQLDPRAAGAAANALADAPDDGFFMNVDYRGAFSPDENWLCGWTAADAFGFLVADSCKVVSDCAGDVAGAAAGDEAPNGTVNVFDLLTLLAQWGGAGSADIAGSAAGDGQPNGTVNLFDLLTLLAAWGACP